MKTRTCSFHFGLILALLAGSLALNTGCRQQAGSEDETATGNGDGEQSSASAPEAGEPFGSEADVSHARMLWNSRLADYESWEPYPGLSGFQPGQSPHGKFLKYYIDETAAQNPDDPGDGAIIVKENFTAEDEASLVAVTIMQKRAGYDPDNQDWFWVKYGPDGKVLANEKGMKLAGRVAKGMDQGCIACHATAGGGDYLFANDG